MSFWRGILSGLLLWAGGSVCAQNFSLAVTSPSSAPLTLTVYLSDGTTHQQKKAIRHGQAFFEGTVEGPTIASLEGSAIPRPQYFWIEPSKITIDLQPDFPEQIQTKGALALLQSPLRGSRSNSSYRILIEDCQSQETCLQEYIEHNPQSVFSPFLLYSYLMEWDFPQIEHLFSLLDGEARNTWHYKMLTQKIPVIKQSLPGSKIQDFTFITSPRMAHSKGDTLHLDSLSHPGQMLLIQIFPQGKTLDTCYLSPLSDSQTADSLIVLNIYLDQQPQGWDTPFMNQLMIPHLPYRFLLQPDNTILARGFQEWQIPRILHTP